MSIEERAALLQEAFKTFNETMAEQYGLVIGATIARSEVTRDGQLREEQWAVLSAKVVPDWKPANE